MELEPVRVRDCACPNAPHGEEGDIVFLLPKPSLALGLAWQYDMNASAVNGVVDPARVRPLWYVTYLRHGAVGWNLTDDAGKAVPFDVEALMADFEIAYPVADRADDLYSEALMRPLLARLNGTSPTGQTAASTSPTVQSIRSRRGRSSRAGSAATVPSVS